jgi:hypothetical protein
MNERPRLPAPVAALFPEVAEGIRTDDWLTQQLAAALGRVTAGPVMPTVDMPQFRRELAALDLRSLWPSTRCSTGPSGSLKWERCT